MWGSNALRECLWYCSSWSKQTASHHIIIIIIITALFLRFLAASCSASRAAEFVRAVAVFILSNFSITFIAIQRTRELKRKWLNHFPEESCHFNFFYMGITRFQVIWNEKIYISLLREVFGRVGRVVKSDRVSHFGFGQVFNCVQQLEMD